MKNLNEFETMLVSGGTNSITLDTVYVTAQRGESYDGLSLGDSIALGGAAGGVYALGMVLTGAGGAATAGDLVAIGTVIGGVMGAVSAMIVMAGVYYLWNGSEMKPAESWY